MNTTVNTIDAEVEALSRQVQENNARLNDLKARQRAEAERKALEMKQALSQLHEKVGLESTQELIVALRDYLKPARGKRRKGGITEEVEQGVTKDARNGMTNSDIANKWQISTASVSKIRTAHGIHGSPGRKAA